MRKAVTKTLIFAMAIAMLAGCGRRENSNQESKSSDTSSTKTSENVNEVKFNLIGEIADTEGKLSRWENILQWEMGNKLH